MADLFLLPTKSRISKLSFELYELNKKHDAFEQQYKERKSQIFAEIKKYADKKGLNSYGIDTPKGLFKFIPIVSKKVIWDIDKLQKKVEKDIFNQFVDKTYTITDYKELVMYLKSCGVNPKKFASFISVDKKVNSKKLDQLSDIGEISMDDIEDCYRVEVSSEYVKISELERQQEDAEN